MQFGIELSPGDIVLDGDPAPPRKGAQQPPPAFWLISIVAKWSPISATAELLFLIIYLAWSFFQALSTLLQYMFGVP